MRLIALLFCLAIWFGMGLSLIQCSKRIPPLPHRAITELTNWGQGRAPDPNHCPPGTVRMITDDDLFLECLRGTN